MVGVQAWSYRDIVLHRTHSNILRQVQFYIILNGLIYGLLLAGVAIDFPSGLIVGLIYMGGYGIGIIGRYIWFNDGLSFKMFGRRPILNYFHLAHWIGLVIVILWIIMVGGMKQRGEVM
jgi:hypothetical protein